MLNRSASTMGRSSRCLSGDAAPAQRFRLAGWDDLWDYSFDDHAVLCDLRSQPGDRRRHVVPLSVCDDGNGSAQTPSCRRLGSRDAGLDPGRLGRSRRDRGAEERKALERDGLRDRRLIGIEKLREDPHLEMHARGGIDGEPCALLTVTEEFTAVFLTAARSDRPFRSLQILRLS